MSHFSATLNRPIRVFSWRGNDLAGRTIAGVGNLSYPHCRVRARMQNVASTGDSIYSVGALAAKHTQVPFSPSIHRSWRSGHSLAREGKVGARPQGRPKARAPSPRGIGLRTRKTRGRQYSRMRERKRAIDCECSWHTRDSVTPSTAAISFRFISCS